MRKTVLIIASLLFAVVAFAQMPAFQASSNMKKGGNATYTPHLKFNRGEVKHELSAIKPLITSTSKAVVLAEGFEGGLLPVDWLAIDQDADTYNWKVVSTGYTPNTGTYAIASASYDNTDGALTPDNWLITPQVSVTSENFVLKFWVVAVDQDWPAEEYSVLVSTTGTDVTTDFTEVHNEILTAGAWKEVSIPLTTYNGENIYIAIRHWNSSDNFEILFDDISIEELSSIDAGITSIVAPEGTVAPGTYDVVVNLKNFGGSNVTAVDIDYDIEGVTGTYNWTGDLAPIAEENVTIVVGHDFTTVGTYNISATAVLVGDTEPANDMATSIVEIANVVSATYTLGDVSTDFAFTAVSGASTCPGALTVTIPVGAAISSVDVQYDMTALGGGWMSEQRSQLRCVSPGGENEAALTPGVGGAAGTFSYNRTGLTIANNVAGGGDIMFELHAGRTYGGSGCSVAYNKVNNNSWKVTVNYYFPAAADAGITAVVEPTGSFYAGAKDVIVTLKNFGIDELTAVDIDWDIEGNIGTYNWVGSLLSGESTNVTITNFDFATAGAYTIMAATVLPGDADDTNDDASAMVNVFEPFTVPFTENFDGVVAPAIPSLWTVNNVNADAYAWATYATNPNSAPNSMSIRYNSSAAMNDWFFSPKIALEAGITYKVSFMYRAQGYNESLKLMWGTDNTPAGMTEGTIFDNPAFLFNVYELAEATITPTVTGAYNFGFNGYSAADMNRLYVDNFSITEVLPTDAAAISVDVSAFVGTNMATEVFGTVQNVGTIASTFDATITINDGASDVFTQTVEVTLDPEQTELVSFGDWTPSVTGVYTATLEVTLTDDANADNNIATKEIEVIDNLLWGNNIDVTGSTNGIVSTNLGGITPGLVETADDFVLPAGEWLISSINPKGFQTVGALEGFMVKIYADNAGVPGDVLFEEIVVTTEVAEPVLTFTEPLVLEGGHYWLMVAGQYSTATALAQGRWNWFTWNNVTEGESMLRDNPDLFGAGATSWTALSDLGVAGAGSTNFAVYGIPYVPYTVTFNVVDEASAPITDAIVTFDGVDYAAGEYIFADVIAGDYEYTVSKDGYVSVSGTASVVDADLNVDITLVEAPVYTVTFNVVDEASAPIVDAIVTFDGVEYAAGEYVFADLEAGAYEYTVAKDGYVSEIGIATVIDADLVIDITLVEVPVYTVTFNVVDEDSAPITDAIITFDGIPAAAGEYVFSDLIAGAYEYTVAKEGFVDVVGTATVIDADLPVDITMIPVGVNTNALTNLNAYPNPFSNQIIISNPSVVSRVVVANLIGQVIMDVRTNGVAAVETVKLSAGIYLVTFEAANGESVVRKMVKK